MTKKYNQYLGKAGHLAVMAEFLILGWNVAIPEVDMGDDIFVVQDSNGTLRRVQVKTSSATKRRLGYSAQFYLNEANLRRVSNIYVNFVFLVRIGDEWSKPVIIRQDYLIDLFDNKKIGSAKDGNITLYFSYAGGNVKCSGVDLTAFVRDFTEFPQIVH